MKLPALRLAASVFLSASTWLLASEPVRLAQEPALSPDGASLAFSWRGDIWTVPVKGGTARRLTQNPAAESSPVFSPDGKQLAFISDREGSRQVFVMPSGGGDVRQLTWHTEGYKIDDWFPDGTGLLVGVTRDHFWKHANRLARLDVTARRAEQVLLDDYAADGSVSPDGKRVLFVREAGEGWWRQGYEGSRSGQIWLLNREDGSLRRILAERTECRWPLWKPDGAGFFYVSGRDGTFNLWEHDIESGSDRQLTKFAGDSVVFPCVSRDGRTVVFRRQFDFYRWRAGGGAVEKINVQYVGDALAPATSREVLERATDVTFTANGLQIAFISGGDVWVMDTELREPRQVTHTPEEERDVVFAPNGKSLWFVSDAGGQADIWKAVPQEPAKYWWENRAFTLTRMTNDAAVESGIQFSADGKHGGFIKERGDLWIGDGELGNAKRIVGSWSRPEFQFSPDGAWIVYSLSDEWFNSDIWLQPLDGSREPFNLSRHPNNDRDPAWSPDGKMIAWTGRHDVNETDIHYVWLSAADDEQTKRERTVAKAREKIAKAGTTSPGTGTRPRISTGTGSSTMVATGTAAAKTVAPKAAAPLKLELEDIHDRIRKISIPDTTEYGLIWSTDSKKLAFAASAGGKAGMYTVEFPDELRPRSIAPRVVSHARWIAGEQIVCLSDGLPSVIATKAAATTTTTATSAGSPAGSSAPVNINGYRFRAQQLVAHAERQRAVFDQCWRVMRDHYYDERLGNRDWNAVRAKYSDMAAAAPDMRAVVEVVQLMLGELNGSHLGFTLNSTGSAPKGWQEETAHLGLRFDPAFEGPGWKVRDVIPRSPAAHRQSTVKAGEILLKIDGRDLRPDMDPSEVLNGLPDRDITLRVKAADGAERDVTLRPISWSTARSLLYEQWIKGNRAKVEKASGGTLGYLHIAAMSDESFQRFQEELFAAGAGRDGLVIDVRENGGGSTTDHLLTALTQPRHAITVPRGGKPGYPQDRIVYATWHKPIVVLCNQNSYSNAEIFSHAIKTLKRGQVVGVPTAGGVISTGAADIMDVGKLRLPFRGWYGLHTGEDMELNGAVPDHVVWPQPGDWPRGVDTQLEKAVSVLGDEVAVWKQRPQPALKKATERKK